MTSGRQVLLRDFNQPLELHKFELAKPAADEILVRVDRAGVCGSDVHTWKGEVARNLPIVLGHEGVGTVDTLGTDTHFDYAGTKLKVGDRVYWATLRPCFHCYSCAVQQDLSACENKTVYGPVGAGNWNSYADYATLPPGLGFFRIPDDTPSDAVIAFGCAMPTMLQAVERLGQIPRASSVVIQGSGPVGLAAVLVARSSGADPIIAIDRFQDRLDMARQLGATHTVLLDDSQTNEERVTAIRNLCGGRGAEIVIEATGAVAAFAQGLAFVARGGRYLLVGLWAGADTATIDPHYILRNNIQIVGSAYGAPVHYHQAVKIAQRYHQELSLGEVVTSRFDLGDAMQAFQAIQRGKAGKAVLVPENAAG